MIDIENLRKSFGDVEVLKGINLTIKEKEVVVIIGPSGSGKSTRCARKSAWSSSASTCSRT